jgi:hypothetical protein
VPSLLLACHGCDHAALQSQACMHRTTSEETRAKMRAAWALRRQTPVSQETRERMRKAKLGQKRPAGACACIPGLCTLCWQGWCRTSRSMQIR